MSNLLAIGMPGGPELIVILVVLLLFFGAKRLPELSRSLGKSLSEFKKGKREAELSAHEELDVSTPGDKEEAPAEKND